MLLNYLDKIVCCNVCCHFRILNKFRQNLHPYSWYGIEYWFHPRKFLNKITKVPSVSKHNPLEKRTKNRKINFFVTSKGDIQSKSNLFSCLFLSSEMEITLFESENRAGSNSTSQGFLELPQCQNKKQ